jgi:hypothetical protein
MSRETAYLSNWCIHELDGEKSITNWGKWMSLRWRGNCWVQDGYPTAAQ